MVRTDPCRFLTISEPLPTLPRSARARAGAINDLQRLTVSLRGGCERRKDCLLYRFTGQLDAYSDKQFTDFIGSHRGGTVQPLVIDLSRKVLPEGTYDEAVFTDLQADLDAAFGINQMFLTTFKVEGELLEYWGRPEPEFSTTAEYPTDRELPGSGPLAGVRIAISPGHGYYWNETYSAWMFQRAVACCQN